MKRWVIKAGSQSILEGGPLLIRAWMQQVETLRREHDVEVIWVTSGAIAQANDRIRKLNLSKPLKKNRSLADKQALSAIGQPLIMDLYNLALQAVSLTGAQILLTYDDLTHSTRRKNFQNTVEKLLSIGVVPILNENDAVATEEIQFGDNDSLSAKIACTMNADKLVILTNVEGLYNANPNKNKKATLIAEIGKLNNKIFDLAKGTSKMGTGGMLSKLTAAKEATKRGIDTHLVLGDKPSVLLKIAKKTPTGTYIRGKK